MFLPPSLIAAACVTTAVSALLAQQLPGARQPYRPCNLFKSSFSVTALAVSQWPGVTAASFSRAVAMWEHAASALVLVVLGLAGDSRRFPPRFLLAAALLVQGAGLAAIVLFPGLETAAILGPIVAGAGTLAFVQQQTLLGPAVGTHAAYRGLQGAAAIAAPLLCAVSDPVSAAFVTVGVASSVAALLAMVDNRLHAPVKPDVVKQHQDQEQPEAVPSSGGGRQFRLASLALQRAFCMNQHAPTSNH
jgi:hypothetical protein